MNVMLQKENHSGNGRIMDAAIVTIQFWLIRHDQLANI